MRLRKKEAGFVLANALILIAALSAVAVAMLSDRQSARDRISVSRDASAADLLSQAGVLFAADLLTRDARAGPVDHDGETWALDGFPAEIDGRIVEVTVTDLSGLFSVNLLRGPDHEAAVDTLSRLSEIAEIDLGVITSRVVPGVVQEPREEPHLFQPGDLAHLAEITTDADVLRSIRETAVALPMAQKINVNAASVEMVAALTGLDVEAAGRLATEGQRAPFETVEEFTDKAIGLGAQPGGIEASLMTTDSSWFLVEIGVTVGAITRNMASILARNPQTGDVVTFMKGPVDAARQ